MARRALAVVVFWACIVAPALADESAEATRAPARYIAAEGYKDAHWGMTPEEATKALPQFTLINDRPDADAGGAPITRLFYRQPEHFFRPELKVYLLFDTAQGLYAVEFYERIPLDFHAAKYRKRRRTWMYNKVWSAALKTKFGAPAGGVMDCDDKTFRSKAGCVAWWNLPETVIRLRYKDLERGPWGAEPVVRYRSKKLTDGHFNPSTIVGPKPSPATPSPVADGNEGAHLSE